jgi:hypothetical protein
VSNIHKSLQSSSVAIDTLVHLENNPRRGDVDAIMASYREFGQMKPIVARKNEDGTATVIAGNHQLEAAIRLGWKEIACVYIDGDEARAIAYAIADNRTMELGKTDERLLSELLLEINNEYSDLIDDLGWDEFEIAAIEEFSNIDESELATSTTFTPPVMNQTPVSQLVKELREDGELHANDDVDHNELVTKGSTAATGSKSANAIVQYTIVFDSVQQQSRWYDFIRWLRSNPSIDGNTTSERLMNFIDEHCEI